MNTDIIIIGGGIIGCATAYELSLRYPELKILLLEKETDLALHQTGRNSGVIHSGIYYKPGSLKAKNCTEGKRLLEEFCRAQKVTYETCGKIIVAVDDSEIPQLQKIFERGQANEVPCALIDAKQLRELEPHAQGVKAIHVPGTGIVDYSAVTKKLAHLVQERGHRIECSAKVVAITETSQALTISTSMGEFESRYAINCAGLYNDHIARLCGLKSDLQIVPFRGEYYAIHGEAKKMCRNLIYPVPDPNYPFLGVHLTRMIDGSVECGPNAVLALGREAYHKSNLHLGEALEALSYGGFLNLARKHWRMGITELWRSFNKSAFVHALQRLVPSIRAQDLSPAPAGIRAQALRPDGSLVDDFVIQKSERMVHVLNAPSPAATSSLNIAKEIAEIVARMG